MILKCHDYDTVILSCHMANVKIILRILFRLSFDCLISRFSSDKIGPYDLFELRKCFR